MARGMLAEGARGALTGAALGTVGAGALEALSPLGRHVGNVVRGIRDPDLEAQRRVAASMQADLQGAGLKISPQEAVEADIAGTPRALLDAGERTRALGRSAANTSPEARAVLGDFVQERFEQQSPRIATYIRDMTGGGNATEDLERIQDVARRANRPAYRAAYVAGEGGIWTPELERLAGSPAVRQAMQNAVDRGRDRAVAEGMGAFNPGVTFENGIMQFGRGRGAPPYPNQQYWDYVQRELRDMQTAARRAGRNEEAGALGTLHRSLLSELDAANPAFGRARQGAASFFGAENTLEAGQNFVRSSANIPEAQRALARMRPAERELFARGYASNLADAVERSGDNRNVLNAAFFNNGAARSRTLLALGPDRARRLEALLRAEKIVDFGRKAVSGNSSTARQFFEMGLAGGATAGAEGLLDQNFSPSHILSAALLCGAARHGAQVIDQRVARRVGELLLSPDLSAIHRGIQLVTKNPRLFNALRRVTGAVAGAGTEAGIEAMKTSGRAAGGRANPAKDHVSVHGLDIGHIKRAIGRDGDHAEVHVGPHPKSPHVFLAGQYDAAGQFRGWKVFLGFGSVAQVRGRGHERLGHVTKMSVGEFKRWLAGNAAAARRAA
jgi:Inorganic Pyrophosphatase